MSKIREIKFVNLQLSKLKHKHSIWSFCNMINISEMLQYDQCNRRALIWSAVLKNFNINSISEKFQHDHTVTNWRNFNIDLCYWETSIYDQCYWETSIYDQLPLYYFTPLCSILLEAIWAFFFFKNIIFCCKNLLIW